MNSLYKIIKKKTHWFLAVLKREIITEKKQKKTLDNSELVGIYVNKIRDRNDISVIFWKYFALYKYIAKMNLSEYLFHDAVFILKKLYNET